MSDDSESSMVDDDFGTQYVTFSHRVEVTLSVPILVGLLVYLRIKGLLLEFPVWMLVVIVVWIVYASVQSVKYYRRGYSNYTEPEENK